MMSVEEGVPQGHHPQMLVGYYIEQKSEGGTQFLLRAATKGPDGQEYPVPLIFDALEVVEDAQYRTQVEQIAKEIFEAHGEPGDRIIKKFFTLSGEETLDYMPEVD